MTYRISSQIKHFSHRAFTQFRLARRVSKDSIVDGKTNCPLNNHSWVTIGYRRHETTAQKAPGVQGLEPVNGAVPPG
jgi:hypothetical protein